MKTKITLNHKDDQQCISAGNFIWWSPIDIPRKMGTVIALHGHNQLCIFKFVLCVSVLRIGLLRSLYFYPPWKKNQTVWVIVWHFLTMTIYNHVCHFHSFCSVFSCWPTFTVIQSLLSQKSVYLLQLHCLRFLAAQFSQLGEEQRREKEQNHRRAPLLLIVNQWPWRLL